jgi:hypothetical protein
VPRRFNDTALETVHIKGRKIDRTEVSDLFARISSRPSSNKARKVDPRGFEPLTSWLPDQSECPDRAYQLAIPASDRRLPTHLMLPIVCPLSLALEGRE